VTAPSTAATTPAPAPATTTSASSAPAAQCIVPRLRGVTRATAKKRLKQHHCAVGKTHRKHAKHVRRGRVIHANHTTGATLETGTKISLTISSGRRQR
jgi:beta-lactam-binding protein with PASTA domain